MLTQYRKTALQNKLYNPSKPNHIDYIIVCVSGISSELWIEMKISNIIEYLSICLIELSCYLVIYLDYYSF